MKNDFVRSSTKEKCALTLLSCLEWGCSAKWSDDIEEKIRRRLKTQYAFDAVRFRSCIDLIQDTELAILNFSRYGLQKFSSRRINNDLGEIYIRLYGVLNSIYLQINTIIELFEVCRIPDKKHISVLLKSHKIYEIRNIVGAHTINFDDKSDYTPSDFKKNFFRITQCQLDDKGDKIHAVGGFGGVKEFNLYEMIMDYNILSEKILYDGTIKYMNSILNGSKHKNEILLHYGMENLKHFDYKGLYKNDNLRERQMNKLSKKFKDSFGDNWKEIINCKLSSLDDNEQFMTYLSQNY